jgi:DNA polymerase
MSDWREILDDTIAHLEEMQRAGMTHVAVTAETLAALGRPAVVARAPAPVVEPPPVVDLPDISARARACTKCAELARCRTQVVVGVGNPRAELMFIGEAPGADEDEQGEPFVGRAGQLLTKIIEAMGFRREEVYIANVLKCRPPQNRTPWPEEIANCLPFLLEQIAAVHPKVIVALGATAVRALLDVQLGITKMRGNWYSFRDIPIMPTFHPAYLLRNPPAKREVWTDMKTVLAKLGRKPPPLGR